MKADLRTDLTSHTQPPLALTAMAAFVIIKLLVHGLLAGRYDYHSDELYFIECGRHLAFGYADHAPMIPWLARLSGEWFGDSLASYRVFPALSGAATIAFAMIAAREFGAGRFAQALTGLSVLLAPAYLLAGSMLSIPAIEMSVWTVASLCVVFAINRDNPKWWLAAGIAAGFGLMTKHTMLMWGLGIAAGALLTRTRKHLATPWPWLGGAAAFVLFLPNLIWQMQNEWATVQFVRNIDSGMLSVQTRTEIVLAQFLYFNPLACALWIGGLLWLAFARNGAYRIFAWLYAITLVIVFVRHGKPYYVAPVYPILLAAGPVLVESVSRRRAFGFVRWAVVGLVLIGGIPLACVGLPLFPMERMDAWIVSLSGGALKPTDLTMEFHRQQGWRHFVGQVAEAYDTLTREEKANAVVLTDTYAQASSVIQYGPEHGLPHAYSGHLNYYLWGPPPTDPRVAVVWGIDRPILESLFQEVAEVSKTNHPLAVRGDNGVSIYVCRVPKASLRENWAKLKRYDHRLRGS